MNNCKLNRCEVRNPYLLHLLLVLLPPLKGFGSFGLQLPLSSPRLAVIYDESKLLDCACLKFPPFHSSSICVQVRSLHNWKHVPVEKNLLDFLRGNVIEIEI